MDLPFCVIDISTEQGKIKLLATDIDRGTPETLKRGGLTVTFSIQIAVDGINADFDCSISLGNLYTFYVDLRKCHNDVNGIAILKDYSERLTNISFCFNHMGQCGVSGFAQNGAYSKNKIEFSIQCDKIFIDQSIKSLKVLFDELAEIQGFYEFPY